jgi:hypothetical protein
MVTLGAMSEAWGMPAHQVIEMDPLMLGFSHTAMVELSRARERERKRMEKKASRGGR